MPGSTALSTSLLIALSFAAVEAQAVSPSGVARGPGSQAVDAKPPVEQAAGTAASGAQAELRDGVWLGVSHPSAPTPLIVACFIERINHSLGTLGQGAPDLKSLVAQWRAWLELDRKLRLTEDREMGQLNRATASLLTTPPSDARDQAFSDFFRKQAAATKEQIRRARQALASLREEAKAKGVPEDVAQDAEIHAGRLLALQQGDQLMNATSIPAANADFYTAVIELVGEVQADGGKIRAEELTRLKEVLDQYAMEVGLAQSERLDFESEVGSKGVEPGGMRPPRAEGTVRTWHSWRLNVANRKWYPLILQAVPEVARHRAEPIVYAMLSPEEFPDTQCLWPTIERFQARKELSEGARGELASLVAWYSEAYPAACAEVIRASGDVAGSMFAAAGGPRIGREKATELLEAAIAKQRAVGEMGVQWLGAIDPTTEPSAILWEAHTAATGVKAKLYKARAARTTNT